MDPWRCRGGMFWASAATTSLSTGSSASSTSCGSRRMSSCRLQAAGRLAFPFVATPCARLLLLVLALVQSAAGDWVQGSGFKIKPPWLWDPDSKNYSWPNVHSYCIPCKKKNVGTCFLGSCYSWRGETDCTLTRCVCKEGYCAKEDALPGQEVCEKQICVGGPRPFPPVHTLPVAIYWGMLGYAKFPADLDDMHDPLVWEFGLAVALRAAWVIVVAILTIVFTVGGFMYYRGPKVNRTRLREVSKQRPEVLNDSMHQDQPEPDSPRDHHHREAVELRAHQDEYAPLMRMCSDPRENYRKQPNAVGLVLAGILTVSLSYAGTKLRSRNWSLTIDHAFATLGRFQRNADVLKVEGERVATTCTILNQTLQDMNTDCSHDLLLRTLADAATNAFSQYFDYVSQLNEFLEKLPGIAVYLRTTVENYQEFGFWFPLIPVMAVAVLCTFLVCEAVFITTFGGLKRALRFDLAFRRATILYAVVVLSVAIFTALNFMLAMTLSSYCHDVDDNTLALAAHHLESRNLTEVYEFLEYYITGAGVSNPAMKYAKKALLYIDEILDVYLQFEGVIKSFSLTCPPVDNIKVRRIAKEARGVLQAVTELLMPANIYPYYEDVVRKAVCVEVMDSFASFPAFTMIIGLILLPICTVIAHKYVVHWSFWKLNQYGLLAENGETVGMEDVSLLELDGEDSSSGEDSDKDGSSNDDSPRPTSSWLGKTSLQR